MVKKTQKASRKSKARRQKAGGRSPSGKSKSSKVRKMIRLARSAKRKKKR